MCDICIIVLARKTLANPSSRFLSSLSWNWMQAVGWTHNAHLCEKRQALTRLPCQRRNCLLQNSCHWQQTSSEASNDMCWRWRLLLADGVDVGAQHTEQCDQQLCIFQDVWQPLYCLQDNQQSAFLWAEADAQLSFEQQHQCLLCVSSTCTVS